MRPLNSDPPYFPGSSRLRKPSEDRPSDSTPTTQSRGSAENPHCRIDSPYPLYPPLGPESSLVEFFRSRDGAQQSISYPDPRRLVIPSPSYGGKVEVAFGLEPGSSRRYSSATLDHSKENPGKGSKNSDIRLSQPSLTSIYQEQERQRANPSSQHEPNKDRGKKKAKDEVEGDNIEDVLPSTVVSKPLPNVPLFQLKHSVRPQMPPRLYPLKKDKGSSNSFALHATNIQEFSDGSPKRWYLQQTSEGVFGKLSKTPLAPVVIGPQDWKCLLDIGPIEKGWYSMVFCISFKSREDLLDTITIDAKELDKEKRPVYSGKTCKTVVKQKEIATIASATPTRLKLYRQIEIQRSGWIEISINPKFGDLSDCKLYYVELGSGQAMSDDQILYGEGAPQQIISVGLSSMNLQKTISIHTIEVSSAGNHAVTLCFDRGLAIVEVWSLQKYQEETSASPLVRHTKPYAQGSFKATLTNHPDFRDISLSISNSGQEVVLHSNDSSRTGIPCHIFQRNPNIGSYSPVPLVIYEPPKKLAGFFGYGSFHCYTVKGSGEWKERYVACDGKTVTIYNPTKDWVLESSITLGSEPNHDASIGLIHSLRSQYFAWTGEKGVVSIWDIESQSQVSYIHVEGFSLGSSACFSKDGSLIAISVKGRISVHETMSGVMLGEYKEGLGEEKFFEVILEKDYFMFLDQTPPKDANSDMITRKIVRISDMSVVKTYPVHKDYMLQLPSRHTNQVLMYTQGSVANIIKLATEMAMGPEAKIYDEGVMRYIQVEKFSHSNTQECISSSGMSFTLATSVSVIHGNWKVVIKISRNTGAEGGGVPENSLTIPLGSSHAIYYSIYMQESSRLAIVTGRYLQVWKLLDGTKSKEVAKLELIWALQAEVAKHQSTDICIRHVTSALTDNEGQHFAMILEPLQWFRRLKELPRDDQHTKSETITYPVSKIDTISISGEYRVSQGIRGAVDIYIDGDADCQRAIIRYLATLVHPSPENTVSCVVTLCRYWNSDNRIYFERIMADLLPSDTITWVPNAADSSKDTTVKRYGYDDPLAILLKTAETQPAAIGVAKVIMDYCVNHANSSKNLAFLSPIFGSMHEVMTLFPEEALECLSRIAFIPAKQRSYIIDNHIIVHPPTFRLQFWKPVQKLLCNTVDPIMQLHVSPTKPDSSNDKFTHPVFMASFDALWFYHDMAPTLTEGNATTRAGESGERSTVVGIPGANALITQDTAHATSKAVHTSWWETLYYMILVKLKLQSCMYVECYDFNLEFFDNPAIAALVDYKWNTIGFSYWLVRFAFQCVFYSLVIAAAMMQVYYDGRGGISGIFVAIMSMSAVFLWLEMQQAIQGWSRYKASRYNMMDLISFSVPMVASIEQLVIISQGNPNGNTRLLSFSVLIVFLHMLLELRINKSGGLYDPISGKFGSDDWAFHIMMIIYFFFTVILMLNVLIALINVAFNKGDDDWRLAWVESRLRYIESAENMSYYIPGYRQTHDWFPKEIYFTATKQQVKAYNDKHGLKDSEKGDSDSVGVSGSTKDKDMERVDVRLEELQRQLQELKDLLSRGHQDS
ncbi:hypothetical protein BGX26_006569 [Mortierella sp. AD094]|nr:hypothetical protein BGX26_006569 [Mortierella sp. AD094]